MHASIWTSTTGNAAFIVWCGTKKPTYCAPGYISGTVRRYIPVHYSDSTADYPVIVDTLSIRKLVGTTRFIAWGPFTPITNRRRIRIASIVAGYHSTCARCCDWFCFLEYAPSSVQHLQSQMTLEKAYWDPLAFQLKKRKKKTHSSIWTFKPPNDTSILCKSDTETSTVSPRISRRPSNCRYATCTSCVVFRKYAPSLLL